MLADTDQMSEEEIDHFKSVQPKACVNEVVNEEGQYANISNTQVEVANLLQMLRDNDIDIDARMDRASQECQSRFASGPLPKNAATRDEAISACTLTNQQILYAKAINEMNAKRQNVYQRERAAYEARLAEFEQQRQAHQNRIRELAEMERARQMQIAEDRAKAQRERAEWRQAVELCEQGKREYCASEED